MNGNSTAIHRSHLAEPKPDQSLNHCLKNFSVCEEKQSQVHPILSEKVGKCRKPLTLSQLQAGYFEEQCWTEACGHHVA